MKRVTRRSPALAASLVFSLLFASCLSENTLRISLEPLFDIKEVERLVSTKKVNEERFRKLITQFSGQVYFINAQAVLKQLYLGISLQEVYPSFMLPECSNCSLTQRNNSMLDKFGQVFKVKCPMMGNSVMDQDECLPFNESGRSGTPRL